MDDLRTAVAVMGETLKGHLLADEKQNDSIDKSLSEIKGLVQALDQNLRNSVTRIHEMREQTAGELREEIAAVERAAQEAKDAIPALKIWTLGGTLAGVIAGAMWLWDNLRGVPKVPS